MVNKIHKISICMLAAVSLFSGAVMANELNRLDIQKSSSASSTLNVTIYTSAPYDDNVAVTKKADNKYVILMPNVSSSSMSGADFSSIKDIVSDVDIKTVADGANGYTKVTLTTTKPVAITTSARKSKPLTPEQKAYKNLIAQSRGYTNVKSAVPDVKPASVPAATKKAKDEKVNEVKPLPAKPAQAKDNVKKTVSSKPVPEKIVKAETKNIIKDIVAPKPKIEETSPKPETEILSVPKSSFTLADLKNETEKNIKQPQSSTQTAGINDDGNLIPEETVNTDQKSDIIDKRANSNMFTTIVLLLCSLLGVGFLLKQLKHQLKSVVALKKTFKASAPEKQYVTNDYSSITDNKNLSWREKYQQYLNTSIPVPPGRLEHVGNGEYRFVNSSGAQNAQAGGLTYGYSEAINSAARSALPKINKVNRFTSYNKPAANISPKDVAPIKKVKNQDLKPQKSPKLEIVEESVLDLSNEYKELEDSLERTLHNSPSRERLELDDDAVFKQLEENFRTVELNKVPGNREPVTVHKEDDRIAEAVRKLPKLRSFANKIALEETKRNLPLPKKRSEIMRSRSLESKYVNLEKSDLYSNRRRFENGALSSADLISDMNNKIGPKKSVSKPDSDGYTMATLDEFFDAVDASSYVTAPASLSSRVADSLGRMSSEFEKINPQNLRPVNPLVSDGSVINAGYNIDKTSGFYIVTDKQGKSSLIGKAGDNITVLKAFDKTVEPKLQVRMDDPNVYMVRAGGERYLVEVSDHKMGVLLEL